MIKPATDKNGMPLYESYAFGVKACALCDQSVGNGTFTRRLHRPVWADYAGTEVLIPGGRQLFHRECWLCLVAQEAEPTIPA